MTCDHYSFGLTISEVAASFIRDHLKGDYLITLMAGISGHDRDGFYITGCPMARAIMDDFGNLVLTREWL